MATTVTSVIDPDNDTGTDYTSLTAWEAAKNGNLTSSDEIQVASCRSSSGTVDGAVVLINGWTTSATQYIRIQNHDAANKASTIWSTSKYRLDISSGTGGTYAIRIVSGADHIEIEGIQIGISLNTAQDMYGIWWNNTGGSAGWCKFGNNFVKGYGTYTVSGYHLGISVYNASTGSSYIWNNIVTGWQHASSSDNEAIDIDDAGVTHYISNNTVYLANYGIKIWNASAIYAKNNIVNNATTDYDGSFTAGSDYNVDEDGTAPGDNSTTGTVDFENEGTDFALVSADTVARGNGTDLSADTWPFSDDIDGNTRSAWDVGAHEYQAAGGADINISVFDCKQIETMLI